MVSSLRLLNLVTAVSRQPSALTASLRPLWLGTCAILLLNCLAVSRVAADWPMWRANAQRTGATNEALPDSLALHWSLQLAPPRPAWPAEQGKVRFDASYDPVVAGGRMFVPSMAHDNVTAYDIVDGRALWCCYVDGPVRFAPVAHGNRLLFVSDDGYLYCVSVDQGELIWKYRGGPADRWVLGNDRLISMWPAQGAPVTFGNTVYFAAGIWPFMGVFVHAVDIETGQPIWTNSGSGSNYITQQHDSPAFAGVAPQGYLAVTEQILLVSGGMTVPAAFDRVTGRFLYYQPGDRTLGRDVGGYEVSIGKEWFANRGALFMLADGQPRLKSPASILAADCAIGIAGKHLVGHGQEITRYVETSVDKKGKETKTVKYQVAELFRARLPEHVSTLHVRAGNQLLAGDDRSRVVLLDIPTASDEECRVVWEGQVTGVVWRLLVSDQRLFVVTEQGGIFCFGDARSSPAGTGPTAGVTGPSPPAVADLRRVARGDDSGPLWRQILAHVAEVSGYAILDGVPDLSLVRELAEQTPYQILVTQPDAALRRQWREELQKLELPGTRVAVLPASLAELQLPSYMANLIVSLQWSPREEDAAGVLQRIYSVLRPYGGTAVLDVAAANRELLQQACAAAELPGCVASVSDFAVLKRPGPLPGAGTWTSQNGDAGNTLVSAESGLRTPLGLLWFGGPPNTEVLPRHGHGPTPQVIGGRLFIEGRDMLRTVDVYTGRLLWQRPFKDVGIFYDNTGHHPGAGAIGGNYVCTEDSIYLIWQRSCLRLDPATGATLAEFQLPKDESGEHPYWGYLGVADSHLVVGSSPMLLHALGPGEKAPEKNETREVPLYSQFGEGSRQLVVLDRLSGQVQWTRDARFNFRHNAIAIGDGKVFCLDRMTEQRLAYYRRRGDVPIADFCLYALDLHTGEPVWESTEHAFGTWLAYEPESKVLLQAGSKNRDRADDDVGEGMSVHDAATGRLWWRTKAAYGGPPMLYRDTIVTQGTAFDLRTGEPKQRRHPLTDELLPWQFAQLRLQHGHRLHPPPDLPQRGGRLFRPGSRRRDRQSGRVPLQLHCQLDSRRRRAQCARLHAHLHVQLSEPVLAGHGPHAAGGDVDV